MPTTSELSTSEKRVLRDFRRYLIAPGQMLCFYGPNFERSRSALRQLTEKGLLMQENFKGAYSLTSDGFAVMKTCD